MHRVKQKLAIAKACGWTDIKDYNTIVIDGVWKGFHQKYAPIINQPELIPDYLWDLNAMHKAEKCLSRTRKHEVEYSQYDKYMFQLAKVVGDYPYCATAAQRAEAFLRTLNLWEDEKI